MDQDNHHDLIEPLPTGTAAHLAHRKLKSRRTLNDLVEDIHLVLVDDPEYVRFHNAVFDEQAVEGSLAADNLEAAHMIRQRAKKIGSDIQNEKKATIAKSLGIVMRRYEWSRKERRNTVRGTVVPTENGDN